MASCYNRTRPMYLPRPRRSWWRGADFGSALRDPDSKTRSTFALPLSPRIKASMPLAWCSRAATPTARSASRRSRNGVASPWPRSPTARAEHPAMPDSAIAAGLVDLVLPAERWAPGWSVRPRPCTGRTRCTRRTHTRGARPCRGTPGDLRRPAQSGRPRLLRLQGAHLPASHAAAHAGAAGRHCQGYLERLRQDPQEVDAPVPRPADRRHQLLPRRGRRSKPWSGPSCRKLFEGRGADARCGSGCRAAPPARRRTRIAMLLREHMDRLRAATAVQIFATDIDERALGVARAGRYPGRDAATASRPSGCGAFSPPMARR